MYFLLRHWKSAASQFSMARPWPKPIGFQGSSATTQCSRGKIAVVSCKYVETWNTLATLGFQSWTVSSHGRFHLVFPGPHQPAQQLTTTYTKAHKIVCMERWQALQDATGVGVTRHAACKWYCNSGGCLSRTPVLEPPLVALLSRDVKRWSTETTVS